MKPLPRRDFLKLSGLSLASSMLPSRPVFAGPFDAQEFDTGIPRDKKLRPEWVKSLTERGAPTVYRKSRDELKFIGMPIGGICCGTVYLGGDGRLWLWDIFNDNRNGVVPGAIEWKGGTWQHRTTISAQDGASYVAPHKPTSPFEHRLAVRFPDGSVRPLDADHWEEIEFQGEYPVGTVRYSDPGSSIAVELQAYSPFIPLEADDSGIPVVIFEVKLTNRGDAGTFTLVQEAQSYFAQTPARWPGYVPETTHRSDSGVFQHGLRRAVDPSVAVRPDVLVDDFDRPKYAPWTVKGESFGSGPILRADVPEYQGNLGGTGKRVVNSHASAPATDVGARDSKTGSLVSEPFTLRRRFLSIEIGGGKNAAEVGIRLLVGGTEVFRAAGRDSNQMQTRVFDVAKHEGQTATFEIYDNATGPWGHIGIGRITQTDNPRTVEVEKQGDFGTIAFTSESRVALRSGDSGTTVAMVAWHFPNTELPVEDAKSGNFYAGRFMDASDVIRYVRDHFDRLSRLTKLWRDTWYGGTLPHWFLERTFANTSILATSTAHRFQSGRFWAWEGVGCCAGTCTHVWHYAQAVGRIFPSIERGQREHVDFGVGFDPKSGVIGHRGERTGPAIDGECGRVLGVLREHQMSADDAFLRRVWPNVKRAIEYLIHHDADGDGLVDGPQENTLDAAWYGKIAWISSLYAAALKAGQTMALMVGDSDFARLCGQTAKVTKAAIENELFEGEYFIQKPESGREAALGTYRACHIDQVHGQSWAWQVGLGRVLDRDKTLSALRALYKYNFAPDVGPFRKKNPEGRPYALAGDGGLVMATNPRGLPSPFGNAKDWQYGYFNECMSGFEHQVASHMIAEGMVTEGLAITRAIHDRYHARLRNPYNEVECSDHYSRAMASYGSFVSMCGFACDGPNGMLQFDPRMQSDHFSAAFTSAESWGVYTQNRSSTGLEISIEIRYGRLHLRRLLVRARGTQTSVPAMVRHSDGMAEITFAEPMRLLAGQLLRLHLS